jgi:hypothetical protein
MLVLVLVLVGDLDGLNWIGDGGDNWQWYERL